MVVVVVGGVQKLMLEYLFASGIGPGSRNQPLALKNVLNDAMISFLHIPSSNGYP